MMLVEYLNLQPKEKLEFKVVRMGILWMKSQSLKRNGSILGFKSLTIWYKLSQRQHLFVLGTHPFIWSLCDRNQFFGVGTSGYA